ncbi:alpha/beta hydrolase [Mitsuaria sp. GD03876]|uniref:alpha/beta hydrolase n=1 Tax=Mitsuaria sp. GD03876 TaxID=2975399 RepID=UPI00244A6156|nr:alpha/beta hydrolase [Mitsuaria sp. GD03876]MDH0866156.1 alpha/beta hydrolase [Mitsuaria sp. GD03876]
MRHSLPIAALSALLLALPLARAADDTGKGTGNEQPSKFKTAIAKGMGQIRLDGDMLALLKAHEGLKPKAIEKIDVPAARANPTIADAVNALLRQNNRSTDPAQLVPGVTSVDGTAQGAAGVLPARFFTPDGPGPFPVVVYFHGGGWVIADKQVYDASARALAKQAQAVVVSVDYRRAPEAKFPAAWDDALAAYRWTIANAARFKGDASRVALAGESAGGNLALATAIAARDAGLQKPAHVLAIYPVTQSSLNTESYLENAVAQPLNRAMVEWFIDKLLDNKDQLKDWRLNLIDARLAGLPPVTLISARVDPLRSDSAKMEDALKKADVLVERRDYEGVTHEFFGTAAVVEKARNAQAFAGERLRKAFGG